MSSIDILQKTKRGWKKVATVAGAMTMGAVANAQTALTINTQPITDGIGKVFEAVGVIGPSIVLVFLAIRAYKWVRAAIS